MPTKNLSDKAVLNEILVFPAGHHDCIILRELVPAVFPV